MAERNMRGSQLGRACRAWFKVAIANSGCSSSISASALARSQSTLFESEGWWLAMIPSDFKRADDFANREPSEPRVTRSGAHPAPGIRISIVLCSVYACASNFSTFSGVSRCEYQTANAASAQIAAAVGTKTHLQEKVFLPRFAEDWLAGLAAVAVPALLPAASIWPAVFFCHLAEPLFNFSRTALS